MCYAVRYLVPTNTGNWAGYVDRIRSQVCTGVDQYRLLRVLPNRLTPVYSKNHYKEENYLKVKTVVFKYITPSYSNGLVRQYVNILVFWVYRVLAFPRSKLLHVLSYLCDSATPYPMAPLVPLVLHFVYWLLTFSSPL